MGGAKQSDKFLKLENLKILVRNKPLSIYDYEKINAGIISETLNNNQKCNIIIHPGGDVIDLLTLLFLATKLCVHNMIAPENFVLDTLQKDEIVLIEGKKAKFNGVVDYLGRKMIALRYKRKSDILYIPVEQSYRVIPYKGNAGSLDKMEGKQKTRYPVTKKIIAALSGIDAKSLTGTFKYSSVIAGSETGKIENLIRDTKLIYNDEKYNFTNVFPSAYYSSVQNHRDFAGNISKAEPVMKFVSRISAAGDLIQSDKNIKNLLILGEKVYQNYLGELDWLLKKKTLENIIVILDWENILTADYLVNSECDFNWYIWDKDVILNNINLFEEKNYKEIAYVTREQDSLINCFIDSNTKTIIVESEEQHIPEPLFIRELLYEISRMSAPDELKEEFLRICYSLLKLFEQSCFPLQLFEKAIEERRIPASHPIEKMEKINELYDDFKKYIISEDEISKLAKIINLLQEFRKQLLYSNPKWDLLRSKVCSSPGKQKAIILCKSYYKHILQECMNSFDCGESVDLFSSTQFYPKKIYDEIIFTGIYSSNKDKIVDSCHGKEITYLLYKSEQKIQTWKNRKNTILLKKLQHKNCFDKKEGIDEETELDSDIQRYVDLDDLMLELIRKKINFQTSGNHGPTVESCKTIIFNTGEIAYFTKHYRPSVVDINNQNLIDGTIDDLRIGDEMVFVKDTNNQDNDIVMDIINRLMINENFKSQYENKLELSKCWKGMLKRYMIDNNYNASDISVCLEIYNVKRHPVTINTWLNNSKIIGPVEEEIYYALAQITEDKFFIQNWENIYRACDDIRKLHTKLKKHLGIAIVNRVTGISDNEFDKMLEEVIGDLTQYAYVVQIERIIVESNIVPVYMSNKLLDV